MLTIFTDSWDNPPICCAYDNSTETHLPYAQKVEPFEMSELEALLGDFRDDFDIDGILEDATCVTADGKRHWTVTGDELNAILVKWDKRM